jgi:hypothetical protein
MAAKKRSEGPSKTDFVRGLPPETTADDAVAKAKEAGISLTKPVFFSLRSTIRKQSGGKPAGGAKRRAKRGAKKRAATAVAAPVASSNGSAKAADATVVERQLWNVIDHFGVVTVKEVLLKIEKQLAAVRRGG